MIVVVDSNAVIRDYRLSGRAWHRLLGQVEAGEVDLVVPEVVLLEVIKHFRADLQKAAAALQSADNAGRRLLREFEPRDGIDVGQEAVNYETHLRETLIDAGARFESPQVSHTDVARRAVQRHAPFKPGGAGYPDALVWELAKELAVDDQVSLVSDNHQDFGGDADGGLHRFLGEELEREGRAGRIMRFPTLGAFNQLHLAHAGVYTNELARRLDEDADYLAGLREELRELFEGSGGELEGFGDIADQANTRADDVEIKSVGLIEVNDVGNGDHYAAFEVEGTARLEFPMLQGEAWAEYQEGNLEDFSLDSPDEAFGDAVAVVVFEATVDADFDPNTGDLTNYEVSSLRRTAQQSAPDRG